MAVIGRVGTRGSVSPERFITYPRSIHGDHEPGPEGQEFAWLSPCRVPSHDFSSPLSLPTLWLAMGLLSSRDALADTAPPSAPQTTSPPSGASTDGTESADAWRDHRLALEGQMALGGPVGLLGAAVDVGVAKWLAFNAGVGISARWATQLALTPRLRWLLFSTSTSYIAIGLEAGVSGGPFHAVYPVDHCARPGSEPTCDERRWSWVLWQNTNLTYEMQARHIHVRFFGGIGIPLASGSQRECSHTLTRGNFCVAAPDALPWKVMNAGIAIGYAF